MRARMKALEGEAVRWDGTEGASVSSSRGVGRAGGGSRVNWRTSTYSSGGACVEVGRSEAVIGVRDSALPESPVLAFRPADWARFTARLRQQAA